MSRHLALSVAAVAAIGASLMMAPAAHAFGGGSSGGSSGGSFGGLFGGSHGSHGSHGSSGGSFGGLFHHGSHGSNGSHGGSSCDCGSGSSEEAGEADHHDNDRAMAAPNGNVGRETYRDSRDATVVVRDRDGRRDKDGERNRDRDQKKMKDKDKNKDKNKNKDKDK